MTVELLERASAALGALTEEVVFVGGATVSLWITDPAAPPPRPTDDVDVIVEVATRTDYYAFEERLRATGFRNDWEVICRWHHTSPPLILDAMPTDPALLGFSSEWQRKAFPYAVSVKLTSGVLIRAVPPPFLLATKLEAYLSRGKGDLLASRDWADIVALVDGRKELVAEVQRSPSQVKDYVRNVIRQLLDEDRILDGVRAQLFGDEISQSRAEDIVLPRLVQIGEYPQEG